VWPQNNCGPRNRGDPNPNNPYIQVCDRPKVAALKQQFPELFQNYKGK
jgi:peptide-methionine (S)-S-oxide reductase